MTQQSISGEDERGEVASLLETFLQVLLFLLPFLGGQDFRRFFSAVGLRVGVGDTDVNNACIRTGPETLNKKIPAFVGVVPKGWRITAFS